MPQYQHTLPPHSHLWVLATSAHAQLTASLTRINVLFAAFKPFIAAAMRPAWYSCTVLERASNCKKAAAVRGHAKLQLLLSPCVLSWSCCGFAAEISIRTVAAPERSDNSCNASRKLSEHTWTKNNHMRCDRVWIDRCMGPNKENAYLSAFECDSQLRSLQIDRISSILHQIHKFLTGIQWRSVPPVKPWTNSQILHKSTHIS